MCDNPCGADGGCSTSAGSKAQKAAQLDHDTQEAATCMKCRERPAEVLARQREPLCFECLAAQLQSKVHGAIRARGVILPEDNVMVAFSGGVASAALLHLLTALRNPRTDRLERRKVAFSMHIVHVDESAAWGGALEQAAAATAAAAAAARAAVQQAAEMYLCDGIQYSCVRLEEVFAEEVSDQQQQQQRLQQLLQGVPDTTGREDLVHHLRTRLLLATAAQLGCGAVARGDCATKLAAHIVAAASKGCGYGLPGDVQLVDARCSPSQPLFFLPLREVGRRELEALCQYKKLPTATAGQGVTKPGGGSSINALAEGFVATLTAHNPGSVSNILATITKLQAFPWNDPPELHDKQVEARMKQRKQPAAHADSAAAQQQADRAGPSQPVQPRRPEVLCPICLAPLADDELGTAVPTVRCTSPEEAAHAAAAVAEPSGPVPPAGMENGVGSGGGNAMPPPTAACCYSCRSQILGLAPAPLGPSSSSSSSASSGAGKSGGRGPAGADIISLLPAGIQTRLRQLAAAENRAAETLAAEAGQPGRQLREAQAERLRAQIAEFLLED